MHRRTLLAALLAPVAAAIPRPASAQTTLTCRVTGYVRSQMSSHTYDGTSVWTREKICAASWNIPIGSLVRVNGLDFTYRVADRGGSLEPNHIDVLVDTVAQAYAIEEWIGGKYATVQVVRWGYNG